MPTVIIAFLSAIALAGVAAWFSITGLMAIFAALPISIAIMAGVLEIAKLVTASILYRNWGTIPFLMKSYLTTAVVVLMLITSLGIFGYLSKAHIEQNAPVSNNIAKIERLEQRITREQKLIDDAETVIVQLDGAVRVLIDFDRISGPRGSRAVREGQQEQRGKLNETIDAAQDTIDHYLDKKFVLEGEVRKFETEVGPIKYLAALIYDDPESHYGTAVRGIILLLIFVFDPLAVLLLVTANHIHLLRHPKTEPKVVRVPTIRVVDEPAIYDDLFFESGYPEEVDTVAPILATLEDEGPTEYLGPNAYETGDGIQHEHPKSDSINEYTSISELEVHSHKTLLDILNTIDTREQIKPLDQTTLDRRSAINDILLRRKKRITEPVREKNPLLNVNKTDENIG